MNFLEFFPLLVFFATYQLSDLMTATAALIISSLLAIMIYRVKSKPIPKMLIISTGLVAFFGGLTLLSDDDMFIKMKPTIVNITFATILSISLMLKKNVLAVLLKDKLTLKEATWNKISKQWIVFFICMACFNEYVWRHYSTDLWVTVRTFGMTGMSLLFTVGQMISIRKELMDALGPEFTKKVVKNPKDTP